MKDSMYHNPMRENVYDVPKLCIEQCKKIEADSRMILTTPEIFELRRILITGCGDSYAAGLAMKPALEELTGLPVEVLPAMQVARYVGKDTFGKKKSTLVIAVSNSGKVSRVAEAFERAERLGGLTLAITGNPESPLAKAAQKQVPLAIPPFAAGSANGVRSYLISMLSLLLVGIRIGEVKLRYMMTDSQAYRDEVCRYAKCFSESLETIDEQILRLAQENADKISFEFLGSGGNYGTAWFGHAKIIEASGDFASHNDLESWMHLNCFSKELEGRCTVIVSNEEGPDRSRAAETADTIGKMKGSLLVVTDSQDMELPEKAERIYIPKCKYDWMSPLLNYLPAALFAGYISKLKEETYGRSGQKDWEAVADIQLITGSKMEQI